MKNVLFVFNAAVGGASLSAMTLMRGLGERGFRCYAIVPPGGSPDVWEEIRSVAADVEVVRIPWWNRRYKAHWFKRPLHWVWNSCRSGFHLRSTYEVMRAIRHWKIDLVHSKIGRAHV